jgi:serine/threonine protein kinase
VSGLGKAGFARLRQQLGTPELPSRYRPVEVIGRGGMGVVWRAEDRLLARDVAVKVLAEHVADDGLAERLAREARILARLEHPGVVAVHDAGTTGDGRTWYAMRLVRGQRLDEAAEAPPSLGDTLRLMTRVAETIAFAHEQGILHRDLKPANVMVGPFGEVLVLDWGVAGAIGAPTAGPGSSGSTPAPGVTAHGTVLGTPGYMAPEQAAGLPADVRSDVHGLGAILRDLLAARTEQPPRPLAAIRDRALAAAAADRYPDVLSFVADLRRFQDGLPVSAHRESVREVLGRWISRYRMPIGLVLAYLLMRLLILVLSGI